MKSVHEWQNDIQQAYLDGRRHEGDTIRDRFAMAALSGQRNPLLLADMEWIAKHCYLMADAMMKERDKNGDR